MSFIRPLLGVCIICYCSRVSAQPIDRQALVRRHTVHITRPEPLSSLLQEGTNHPSILGALGMPPLQPITDTAVMRHTFDWIWDNWDWQETWGWDFPLVAMTATRLGMPEKAIGLLPGFPKDGRWKVRFEGLKSSPYPPANAGTGSK